MRVLILSQKISDIHINILKEALPEGCQVDIITGSKLERYAYIEAPAHDPESLISRMKCWLMFYRFVLKWAKENKNTAYDMLFATSNPPVNGFLGVKLKKKFRSRFVYMNWDLYPQVIETSMKGMIPRIVSNCWNRLNDHIYPQVDQMMTIGKVMGKTLNKPLKHKVDVKIVPMFTDTGRLKPIPKGENPFCVKNGLCDKFIVLYSGKMGLGHNLELLLEASLLLQDYKDILFLFIGHGQKYGMVWKWIEEHQAGNVRLMPLQSEDIFPFSMACGDVGFISQEKKAAKCFMPAKTYDMMACGMALVTYSEGRDDLTTLVHQEKLGIAMTEDDPEILADNILRLYDDRVLLKKYADNARRAAVEKYDVHAVAKEYQKVFLKIM